MIPIYLSLVTCTHDHGLLRSYDRTQGALGITFCPFKSAPKTWLPVPQHDVFLVTFVGFIVILAASLLRQSDDC